MPYMRQGALKISDHWVRSPLLNIARACQTCHHYEEGELLDRAHAIQDRTHDLLQRAGNSLTDLFDAVKTARAAGATDAQLTNALAMHRKAQWRLDFVAAENSMGFHAPQESARVLAEAIDYARQGQIEAQRAHLTPATQPTSQPSPPPLGITPAGAAPPGRLPAP
jgi:nitrite reductase (cytochrome c-552)